MNIFNLLVHLILEKDEKFNLSDLIIETIKKYNNENISKYFQIFI